MKKQFSLYTFIGIFNTGVHWIIFAALFAQGVSQAWSNLAGFLAASLFSYVVNSKYTFQTEINLKRYLLFMFGMALISLAVGWMGDFFAWHPLITLISFSLISLILGFLWSKFVVFRD